MSRPNEYSYMPEQPCNNGCPRSTDSDIAKALGWLLRKGIGSPDGCGYKEECHEREIRKDVRNNYRGDFTYLNEKYGKWPPPTRDPESIIKAAQGYTEDSPEPRRGDYSGPLESPSSPPPQDQE